MKLEKCLQHISDLNGKFFTIRFRKRTDRTIREMTCRTHLAPVPGGAPRYSFATHKLIPVYETATDQRKVIPIEGITEIKIDGAWKKVTQPPLHTTPSALPLTKAQQAQAESAANRGGPASDEYAKADRSRRKTLTTPRFYSEEATV